MRRYGVPVPIPAHPSHFPCPPGSSTDAPSSGVVLASPRPIAAYVRTSHTFPSSPGGSSNGPSGCVWMASPRPCLRTPLTRFLFLSAPRFEGVGFFAGLIVFKLRASCAPSYEFGEREGDVRHHLRLVVIPMALDAGTTAHLYA